MIAAESEPVRAMIARNATLIAGDVNSPRQ